MAWLRLLAGVIVLAWATPVLADDPTRILVTIADAGMSNAARAGPPRPGYTRRTSGYLVSVGVRRKAERLAREYDLEVVDEWPIVALSVHCLVYELPDGKGIDELLEQLRQRPEVESVQPLHEFEVGNALPGPATDPYTELQHNLDTLELIAAHAWSRGGGTRVTIIDTGADLEHPDLASRIHVHEDFTGSAAFSADAHGTAVAGIIGAASGNGFGMTGVAPDTEMTLLRACWYADDRPRAVCDSFTLAKALAHVLDSATDVINLSLSGPHDPLLSRLLELAIDRGIVVVAAAPAAPGFPADVAGVIVVGAQPDGTGHKVTLVAPGTEILVPVPGGGFDYASGSSLSAAHVSGVVALIIAERPDLGHEDIATLLAASVPPGNGSINACRALASLLQRSGCRDNATVRNDH
jgi:subtilisin family serine protease